MKTMIFSLILSVLCSGFCGTSFAADEKAVVVTKKDRPYPGGRDEEDLKVQESLSSATILVDRRTIENKVLKSYFKKAEADSAPAKKQ